jgi:hypothetical protein
MRPMALRFAHRFEPTSADQLTALQKRQLREAGRRYDGQLLPAGDRFENDDEESVLQFLEVWQVEDDGKHVYDAYFYMADSGTLFRRGTLDVVAEMIQTYFDHPADETLRAQLQSAWREAHAKPAKKTTAKKTAKSTKTVAKTAAKTAVAKKTAAKKTAKSTKTAVKKTVAKKTPAKKTAKKSTRGTANTPAKKVARRAS